MDLYLVAFLLVVLLAAFFIFLFFFFNRGTKLDENQIGNYLAKHLIPFRDEISKARIESNQNQKSFEDSLLKRLAENSLSNQSQMKTFSDNLDVLTKSNENRLIKMYELVDGKMKELRENNSRKLDQMREVVDEKLQKTLDNRLNKAFDSVGEKLERMHKGLGEVNKLHGEVSSLNRVFHNVKSRGIIGEQQLENILEDHANPGSV